MEQAGVIAIAIIFTLIISWVIAEFFGRAKHIGFGWTLALTATTAFIGGIIAVAASPSAKKEPTKGGKNYKIAAWVCFVFGGLNLIAINPMVITFFVLGAYLLELSKGEIVNNNPKFYFSRGKTKKNQNSSPSAESHQNSNPQNPSDSLKSGRRIQQKIADLKNLYDKGILSAEEFEVKIKELEKAQLESRVRSSPEYRQLKTFYDEGFLSSNEFFEKVELLKKNFGKQKKSDPTINRSSLTLRGFKKAIEIYNIAIFRNNGEMIHKLTNKLQKILNIKHVENPRNFVRTALDEYNSQLNLNEQVKIISSIEIYNNTRRDIPNATRYIVNFTDKSEREFWHSSYDLYVILIKGEKEYFPYAKECLNYITNNE